MSEITYDTVLELARRFQEDEIIYEAIQRLAKPKNISEFVMGCVRMAEDYLGTLTLKGETVSAINYTDARNLFMEKLLIHADHHGGRESAKPVEKDNENVS